MPSSVAAEKKQTDRQKRADDDDVDPSATERMWLRPIDLFGSFDSLWCDLKCPSQHDRDWKPNDNQNND